MNPVIHACSSASQAAQRAGELLSQKLALPGPILLLLSGGSSLKILESTQLNKIDKRVTISVLDERLSADPAVNNFAQLARTDFLKQAIAQGAQVIDTRAQEGETLDLLSARFEWALREWREKNPDGHIVITQGIGSDGHTAGIFPYPEDPDGFKKRLDNPDRWVIGYEAGAKNQYPQRVTVTLPFLRMVDLSILFACGEEKKDTLVKMLMLRGSLAEIPARIVQEMRQVDLFTDLPVSR